MGGLLSPTDPTTSEDRNMSIDNDVKVIRGTSTLPGSSSLLAGASPSSEDDSPDHDQDQDMDLPDEADCDGQLDSAPQLPAQPPKRKGGRKPIYATSEERKQRNRQAQAAFRERRTEYIKQLEATIKRHEDDLANLRQSNRQALEECLMLRYKNSLLERILLEKGIDPNAELTAKTGSPHIGPTTRIPTTPNGLQGVARFPLGKYQRRPLSVSSKPEALQAESGVLQNQSPLTHPNHGSHLPSPIAPLAPSPNFMPQNGPISPPFPAAPPPTQQLRPQPTHQLRPQQLSQPQQARTAFAQTHALSSAQSSASGSSLSSAGRDVQPFYISPFQNHYDQLEQEYDAQAMLDDQEAESVAVAFPTSSFSAPALPPQVQPHQQPPQRTQSSAGPMPPASQNGPAQQLIQNGSIPASFDSFDQMVDPDPFGLTASMHFPTPFSFDARR